MSDEVKGPPGSYFVWLVLGEIDLGGCDFARWVEAVYRHQHIAEARAKLLTGLDHAARLTEDPGYALFADGAPILGDVSYDVVIKRCWDSGRPAISSSTRRAHDDT